MTNREKYGEQILDILASIENKGYNKAIEEFSKALLNSEVIDKSIVRRIAEQLKKGYNEI